MAIIKARKNLHGANVAHLKNTKDCPTQTLPIPPIVKISMVQHMGAPCIPLVAKGEHVDVGQKIGESSEFFSAPIHSSCSGIVAAIEDFNTPSGAMVKAIIIETDGLQTICKDIKKPVINTMNEFIEAIRQSGLVGLGGAGFPTHVKLAYKDIDRVDKLVINAAECEPYITADYRECLENTDNIMEGIKQLQKFLKIKEVYIGVEDNKPHAIQTLNNACKDNPSITIVKLKSLYPQGSEKSIIYATTLVTVPAGKLPADCGVIVMNISSVGFVGSYLNNGIPLISKRLTVDGDFVVNPRNLLVPIGAPINFILEHCGILDGYKKVLMGGPMMGIPLLDITTPVIKNNNAIIALSEKATIPPITTSCIRCGKCISACPMTLMPARLEKAYEAHDTKLLEHLSISLCINCGCCTYVCPAKRHLAQKNQLAKIMVRNAKKNY